MAAVKPASNVANLAPGTWQVDIDGRRELVYVVDSPTGRWAFCRGLVVFEPSASGSPGRVARSQTVQPPMNAPMPARILAIAVSPGQRVRNGDTLIIVEAMKMELPLRAVADATVEAIHCHEGQLVSPDDVLIEFRSESAG